MKTEIKIALLIAIEILAFSGVFGAENPTQTGNEIPKLKIIEVVNSNLRFRGEVILN